MTPTYPTTLPHADALARVRAVAGRTGRMADALRPAQWRDLFETHPDLVVMHGRCGEDG